MKQFQQTHAIDGLECLLPVAKGRGLVAAELEILLTVLPVHINNYSYPINNLVEEAARAWRLCLPLLDGICAKPDQPCSPETLGQINEFFQVSEQASPGMKVVLRVDWLLPQHYQQSVSKPHQFELREEIFAEQAIEYLGRQLSSQMIAIFDRKFQSHTSVPLPDRIDVILQTMALIEKILDVSH